MCYNPIKVKYHDSFKNYRGVLIHPYNNYKVVNCGSCLECREQYIDSWYIRWNEQLKVVNPDSSFMITLTYNDENLPYICTPDGEIKSTLNYPDVQKFLKRLRRKQEIYCKKLGIENPTIKYHGSGEYGKNFTKRPHYHILLTNVILPLGDITCKQTNTFAKIWGKGFVDVGTDVTPDTISYILKYTLKVIHSKYKPKKHIIANVTTRTVIPFPITHYNYGTFDSPYYGKLDLPKTYGFRSEFYSNAKTQFKYYPKGSVNEYRIAEKSFCSKGIGKNYLTKENIQYHRDNPNSTYDYYDLKKRVVKQKPLPRYYHEIIYNPILKINGKNQYDENKRPIREYDKNDYDSYINTPLFKKQLINYISENKRLDELLKKYKYDYHLMVKTESKNRAIRKLNAMKRRLRIEEFQRYNNYINNLELI